MAAVLDRAPALGAGEWWLTAGVLFQYAPHGLGDVLGLVVRPNPASPAPRDVYESKAARWRTAWPELTVLPWGPDRRRREQGRGAGPCSVPWQA